MEGTRGGESERGGGWEMWRGEGGAAGEGSCEQGHDFCFSFMGGWWLLFEIGGG